MIRANYENSTCMDVDVTYGTRVETTLQQHPLQVDMRSREQEEVIWLLLCIQRLKLVRLEQPNVVFDWGRVNMD